MAVFLCSNLIYAAKPLNSNDDNLADLLIEKMGKDVVLTDSQKLVVKQKLKTYIVKMKNAQTLSNGDEKFSNKKQANNEYQSSLDSILTSDQKLQLNVKIKERENAKISTK